MKTVFRKLPYLLFKNQIWLSKHTFSFQNTHLVFDHTFQIRYFSANSVFFQIFIKTIFGFQNTHLVFKTQIRFLKYTFQKPYFNNENQMWFSEIRILKAKFGFQNTHTDFKTQIRLLILLFWLFQNSQHIDDTAVR
jgi:hypothetical protein